MSNIQLAIKLARKLGIDEANIDDGVRFYHCRDLVVMDSTCSDGYRFENGWMLSAGVERIYEDPWQKRRQVKTEEPRQRRGPFALGVEDRREALDVALAAVSSKTTDPQEDQ